jgi:hypothetical protein
MNINDFGNKMVAGADQLLSNLQNTLAEIGLFKSDSDGMGYNIGAGLGATLGIAGLASMSGGPIASLLAFAGDSYADTRQELLAQGYDKDFASKVATPVGAISGLIGVAGFNTFVSGLLNKKGLNMLVRSYVVGAVTAAEMSAAHEEA